MNKKYLKTKSLLFSALTAFTFFLTFPILVFAQEESRVVTYIKLGTFWIQSLVYIVMGMAVLAFFWGVVRYISAGAEEEGRKNARDTMIWGVAGVFVMSSLWGIITLLRVVFGVNQGEQVSPGLPGLGVLAPATNNTKLSALITDVGIWIGYTAYFVMFLAILYFFWGIFQFIGAGADEEKRTEGKRIIAYGLIAIFVMFSIWGLVYLVGNVLGVGTGTLPADVPQIDGSGIEIVGDSKITGESMGACVEWKPSSGSAENTSLKAFVCLIISYLKPIPGILTTLAVLYLFWGIVKYIGAGGEEEIKTGRNTIIFGIIGLFVVVALWGLVVLVGGELGLG